MIIPVILSGGAGSRLWPVSREGHPKPFIRLADGQTLLEKTYLRAKSVLQKVAGSVSAPILTVTNRDYYFMSLDTLEETGGRGAFLLEPFGKNTAPAVALATSWVAEKFGDSAQILVLAADHLIQNTPEFTAAVRNADCLAQQGYMVTFGITPTGPETGYGYIEVGEPLAVGHTVARFVEKPDFVTAKSFLESGGYLWNSGMFCFNVGVFKRELELHAPELAQIVERCRPLLAACIDQESYAIEIPEDLFELMPDISIDYAVMEKSASVAVVGCDIGWTDIGSWSAMSDLTPPDESGNRLIGDVLCVGSKNLFVQTEDRLVAAVGIEDLMIIDTADALLVAKPDKAQDVKKIVVELKRHDHEAHLLHKTVMRPWGQYKILESGVNFKIKRIVVKPGASLSLQMHHHRSEHWVVVSGVAKVTNGEETLMIQRNQSTYIPQGHRHRLENPGNVPCVLIEVQCGEYLGEDDIVRFDDQYGRS